VSRNLQRGGVHDHLWLKHFKTALEGESWNVMKERQGHTRQRPHRINKKKPGPKGEHGGKNVKETAFFDHPSASGDL